MKWLTQEVIRLVIAIGPINEINIVNTLVPASRTPVEKMLWTERPAWAALSKAKRRFMAKKAVEMMVRLGYLSTVDGETANASSLLRFTLLDGMSKIKSG
jgi:hypothetical protein